VRRIGTFVIVFVTLVSVPGLAWAAWHPSGTGNGYADADTMPVGDQPDVSLAGHTITVSWSASQMSDGSNVAGYVVSRYDNNTDALQTTGSGCNGVVTALTCAETLVPAGDWYYTITPVKQNWIGDEGPASNDVTIDPSSFVFTSATNLTALPKTLNGTISNYQPGETVTFRLDNPTTGTILTGSIAPNPVPGSGTATTTTTIPAGTSNGIHQVYAVGSVGSVASAGFGMNVADTTNPVVSATLIGKTAGGTPAFIHQGGTYYVYANANDPGVPSSGVSQVRANVSNITTGQTNVLLSAG
jgi:hypothetical protein